MKLTPRQQVIVNLVRDGQPITSEALAAKVGVTRAALRPDLAILTMLGILDARPKVGYIYVEKPSESLVKQYISNIKVGEIMSKPVFISEEVTVYDAIVLIFLNDVGTMFVVDSDQCLIGAVSRKDFLKIAIGGTDIHKVPVGVIMTRMPNIIWAESEESAFSAAKKIITHEIDCIPVVERVASTMEKEQLRIVGKISKTNITKLFLKLADNNI
ncbi:helix-turn-helix transcriptional regulator [Inconstantimicrobium mannanitabidum]|uniref:Uncharacterized protein n=1 Tax=Inconstantimicrobium mannanitabidum TaxID=1604901 RepID=A0ACB5R973_9CLOT|nr:helix-turn-helix transcriptional regulator [Clostridium sp. TW13]GKX65586.1 hypothetical protein rsdtw13_08440 [Clostridium sp. TW13]